MGRNVAPAPVRSNLELCIRKAGAQLNKRFLMDPGGAKRTADAFGGNVKAPTYETVEAIFGTRVADTWLALSKATDEYNAAVEVALEEADTRQEVDT